MPGTLALRINRALMACRRRGRSPGTRRPRHMRAKHHIAAETPQVQELHGLWLRKCRKSDDPVRLRKGAPLPSTRRMKPPPCRPYGQGGLVAARGYSNPIMTTTTARTLQESKIWWTLRLKPISSGFPVKVLSINPQEEGEQLRQQDLNRRREK